MQKSREIKSQKLSYTYLYMKKYCIISVILMGAYGFPIIVTVKKITGTCRLEHKVGDQAIVGQMEIKGKLCNGALATIYPTLYAFQWGAEFPWDKNRDITEVPCVDGFNLVIFELKRDRKHPWYTEKEDHAK
jgi:uncharacterized repeat protein (TIGR04076 family)